MHVWPPGPYCASWVLVNVTSTSTVSGPASRIAVIVGSLMAVVDWPVDHRASPLFAETESGLKNANASAWRRRLMPTT